MGGFAKLIVYQKAFTLAMDIFRRSQRFPKEEKYGLTIQIRKSSRSVCASIAEAYRKRRYEKYFVSKSTDADMENTETQVWLNFAVSCGYLEQPEYENFHNRSLEIGKMFHSMIHHPEKFR